eukprot:5405803-Amphidinium_carterae.1
MNTYIYIIQYNIRVKAIATRPKLALDTLSIVALSSAGLGRGEEGAPVYLNATTTLDSSSRSRLTYQQNHYDVIFEWGSGKYLRFQPMRHCSAARSVYCTTKPSVAKVSEETTTGPPSRNKATG